MLDLSTLNEPQRQAVTAPEVPLLILAGAGSGKTRVLTYRIAWLIEQGVNPRQIMAVTFTNKAASEMRERLTTLVGDSVQHIWSNTFHSICVRLLRRHLDKIGLSRNFSIFDDADTEKLCKKVVDEFGPDIDHKLLASTISDHKINLRTPQDALGMAQNRLEILYANAYGRYQDFLAINNALDFDDLIMKTVHLLQNDEEVKNYYQGKFKYVLVDEYQDVNKAQYEFTKAINGRYQIPFVVGDDYQSIYAFRGADITNILNFERDYPNAQVIKLEQNYRSTGHILSVANSVIQNNRNQKHKELWTSNLRGTKIGVYGAFGDREEAQYVAARIQNLMSMRDYNYSDFCILYRANYQSRSLEEAFLNARMPYIIVGGLSFYQRKEVKDILAYLKLLANPNDGVALRRIINVPRRNIGDTTVDRLDIYAGERAISLLEAARRVDEVPDLKTRAKNSVKAFVEFYDRALAYLEDHNVPDTMDFILNESGYRRELVESGTDEDMGRVENLGEFYNVVTRFFQGREQASLQDFLQDLALIAEVDEMDDSANVVKLMTVHNSKGLEFPVVFVIGFEEGTFPHGRCMGTPEEVEEERRLCYVALTRAKKELYLSHCQTRMVHGQVNDMEPSRFLYEIPRELVEEGGYTL